METNPVDPQQEECFGLFISYDEEASNLTFEWNPETHPQYNYLESLSQEQMSQLLLNSLENSIKELEKENQQQKEQGDVK